MSQGLTNFLTTMILILIFPTVTHRQHLTHHQLGDFQELFFETDHRQLKLHQTWEQIGLKLHQIIGELDRIIEKEKPKEEFVPDENIVFSLPKIPTILDNEDFEVKQEIKKQKDDEINEEIDLTRLKDEIYTGEIPKEIGFYFGRKSYNFF